MTRRQAFIVLTVGGSILWFGGLFRLFAEAAARLLSAVRPDGLKGSDLIVAGLIVALVVAVFVVLLPWYRKFYRQMRADAASLRGIPVDRLPTTRTSLQRVWKALAINFGGAILVALVLPGLVAAALAIVVGLALRLVGIAIAPGSATGSTSP